MMVIYPSSNGNNGFDDCAVLRNMTGSALIVDVHLTGLPGKVTLRSPVLPGIQIGANTTISNFRIGQGTTSAINPTAVARVYDAAPGSGPAMRLMNCRFA